MIPRILRLLALAIAILMLAPVGAPAAPPPQRIVAVGDLHGDYAAWIDIARAAGLIDSRGRWAGGKTVLVQLGDVTDRAPDSLKIIRHLQKLRSEASRAGGKVVVILGNHEAMNLLGDTRYTTAGEYAAFVDRESAARREAAFESNKITIEAEYRRGAPAMTGSAIHTAWINATPLGWVEHRIAWGPRGELGRWATGNPAIAKIGGTLFVHGGISIEYSKLPLDRINRLVAAAMARADDTPRSILTDPLGPLWYRGLVGRDPEAAAVRGTTVVPPTPDEEITAVLMEYGAQRIVVGHTPILSGITISGNGRLARVDTGNSRFYNGQLSYLEILGDRMIPHAVSRNLSAHGRTSP
jgi:hypothetical protein